MTGGTGRHTTITVSSRMQGPTGQGQGGWTAGRLQQLIDQSVRVRFRAPIPLDSPLMVMEGSDGGWHCHHDGGLVLEAHPSPLIGTLATQPVSVDEAEAARRRHPIPRDEYPLPYCFSCGVQEDSMGVRPGPLADGRRFATDWTAPAWAADRGLTFDGSGRDSTGGDTVDPSVLWAALDCTSGVFASIVPSVRFAVTGELQVDVHREILPGERLALVAWDPGDPGGWDGRKRPMAAQAFDEAGTVVATASSLWIALDAA